MYCAVPLYFVPILPDTFAKSLYRTQLSEIHTDIYIGKEWPKWTHTSTHTFACANMYLLKNKPLFYYVRVRASCHNTRMLCAIKAPYTVVPSRAPNFVFFMLMPKLNPSVFSHGPPTFFAKNGEAKRSKTATSTHVHTVHVCPPQPAREPI